MERPNLFEKTTYELFLSRVHKIQANTQPRWGTMSAAQMFAHCTEIQEACNGKPLEKTPFFIKLFKGLIRKSVLNDKPYPKGGATHPQYIITEQKDFDRAKERFLASLEVFLQNKGNAQHTLFGKMSVAERNWAIYKHHNHHLEQFGV